MSSAHRFNFFLHMWRLTSKQLKSVQKKHWQKALAHAHYLKAHPVGYMPWRPEAMMMWLESWRLQRLRPALTELGVDVKEDLLDLEEHQFENLNMRLLEERRFKEALQNLMSLIRSFNFLSQRKSCIPTFETWMKSLKLTHCREKFTAFGAVELVDLDDMDDVMFKTLKLTKLQEKHYKIGLLQITASKREAMADGVADMETLNSTIEAWRLQRLGPKVGWRTKVSSSNRLADHRFNISYTLFDLMLHHHPHPYFRWRNWARTRSRICWISSRRNTHFWK